MNTRVTELLGIRYPIIQGGMAWVAEQHLAAAVSEAGGLGLIGGASAPGEVIRDMLRDAKRLTDAPVGVNVMLMSPHADDVARVVIEEGVKVVTTGAGMPSKYMEDWKKAGIKVIPVVASVAQARIMERLGADAVVAEGTESGGHDDPASAGRGRREDSGHRRGRHCRRQRNDGGFHARCIGRADRHALCREHRGGCERGL